jgi:ABC-type amino acid transport substrate-binding protein
MKGQIAGWIKPLAYNNYELDALIKNGTYPRIYRMWIGKKKLYLIQL